MRDHDVFIDKKNIFNLLKVLFLFANQQPVDNELFDLK